MLAKVIIENGQKKIQALTADTGTGAPVGSYLYLEKKSNPQGYLYCDGSTFDETAYPALYQYLGTNVLPDWREFSAVGAEQNTTNVYDAQTNPNGVIHDHDVFAQGEAKDDQVQEHYHKYTITADSWSGTQGSSTRNLYTQTTGVTQGVNGARVGTVTRGKSRAVFIYIKATSGLTENQQENVLNTINENNSYSTEEHATGKKWIDGKPTYERSFFVSGIGTEIWTDVTNASWVNSISRIIDCVVSANDIGHGGYGGHPKTRIDNGYLQAWEVAGYSAGVMTLEYTKTTDN